MASSETAHRRVCMPVGTSRILDSRHWRRLTDIWLASCTPDIHNLPCTRVFDIATAARVLQWLTQPQRGLDAMRQATRPGGLIVVLEYNDEKVCWQPAPPVSMQRFYAAFLKWRSQVEMENAIWAD